jgi:lipoprotein-anchoring transpeptidase ErfK/SrfK
VYKWQELQVWTPETVDSQASEPEDASAQVVEGASPAVNITYMVQEGEHLSMIARRYGMTWPVLAQVNGIVDPNHVYAGQELIIPALDEAGGIIDMGIITPIQGGPGPTTNIGKQIIVDLSDSRIYAYQDGVLIRNVLVSTGLPGTPTVQGDFTIRSRVRSQRMTGPGYDLPNVEWVQYFYQAYAIHGTYWHNNFGQPMSHGCVNLPNSEAQWFWNFASIGTPVRVQW